MQTQMNVLEGTHTPPASIGNFMGIGSFKNQTSEVPLENTSTTALREQCPLPSLMGRMGYSKCARSSCSSPFRNDNKPSWGIYQQNGRWYWKDHGTGDHGDEVEFIARAKGLNPSKDFRQILEVWKELGSKKATDSEMAVVPRQEPRQKPNRSGFGPGNDLQLAALSNLRGIDLRGLLWAEQLGLLVFGRFAGFEVFGVTDASGHTLEVRRLDGKPFPAHETLMERKSHALKGSRKDWPVGIANIGDRQRIVLLEGLPDLLAACEAIVREGQLAGVAPVSMLSAKAWIGADALPLFKGKEVRIVPHSDEAGMSGAQNWKQQLMRAGASKVDFLLLAEEGEQAMFKDLNDYLPVYREDLAANSVEGRIL